MGDEGLNQVIGAFRTAFPDIHWVIEEMVAEGDHVFSRFAWRGTHRGEFFGVPATGKQISVKGMVVDRVVGGKMLESRSLMDDLSVTLSGMSHRRMPDIYVRYAASETEELKPCGFSQGCGVEQFASIGRQTVTQHLAMKRLPRNCQSGWVENRLRQLRASWTNVSCLETVPVELQRRTPDFVENGMPLWTIKN
jgi:hypothetical protein